MAAEPVGRQESGRRIVDDAAAAQEIDLRCREPELLQGPQEPSRSRDDAVAAATWQFSGEHLEHRAPASRSAAERGRDHREFVVIGQQACGHEGKPMKSLGNLTQRLARLGGSPYLSAQVRAGST
jgi:hypothetical protein